MAQVSRRIFLLQAGGTAAVLPVRGEAGGAASARATGPGAQAAASQREAPGANTYLFFQRDEAAFIEAATERLIPPDVLGPGAREAAVPIYMDRQLGGAWGAGERLYRAGPWQSGEPTQGYQLPFTPAELFRTALRGVRLDLQQRGSAPFEQLDGTAQDTYLTRLQTTQFDLDGVPSKVFFESLLAMTIEGYFSDPVYGGNRGMAAWRMIGFPGAHAAYYELVDKHGIAFTAAPRSLSEVGGQVHVMPGIPATSPVPRTTPSSTAPQQAGGHHGSPHAAPRTGPMTTPSTPSTPSTGATR